MTIDFVELAERVGKTTGPDKELDKLVLCAVAAPEGAWVEMSKFNGEWYIAIKDYHGNTKAWEPSGWRRHGGWPLTASTDAALALVERLLPGRWITILDDATSAMWLKTEGQPLASLPLFILAAALKSLSEKTNAVE